MKKVLLVLGLLITGLLAGAMIFRYVSKSHSPETDVIFEDGDLKITVFYNRPYKKGRLIFGGLVPYGKTWRTGANEATVFETSKDIVIGGKTLKKGRYSLWTVPEETSWSIVFNSKIPPWGIDVMNNGEAARSVDKDVLVTVAPVVATEKEFEQFTISIEKTDDMVEMIMAWDKTLVAVLITPQ